MYKGEENKTDGLLCASHHCRGLSIRWAGAEMSRREGRCRQGWQRRGKHTHTLCSGTAALWKREKHIFSCIYHSTQGILPLHMPVSRGPSEQNEGVLNALILVILTCVGL